MVKGLQNGWGSCFRTVRLSCFAEAIACWKDTIAVGLPTREIITLDGTTGIQMAILSGHTGGVGSLAFMPDGTSLVSASGDKTIKLWDVQTGGVVRTFYGHTATICSVSISPDCTVIASGAWDKTIRLWDIQAEECHHVIEQQDTVHHVRFSPMDPQYLVSVTFDKIWHWNTDGSQTKPAHNGSDFNFSQDGTQFVSYDGNSDGVVIQNSTSGGTIVKSNIDDYPCHHCCFSPDGRLIAAAAGFTVYVWDTTSSHPHPIRIFAGHTGMITSLAFFSPSFLISSSQDYLIKFWEIGILQADPAMADLEPIPPTSAEIQTIALQVEDGIAISCNLDGVVRTWDISTGSCKATFQTMAGYANRTDVQLTNNGSIIVWSGGTDICVQDLETGELRVDMTVDGKIQEVKLSGDGSIVFCLCEESIQALSTWTGEVVGKVGLGWALQRSITVHGSRVWSHSPWSESKSIGWDFGTPGSPPVQLSNSELVLPHNAKLWDADQCGIKDGVTGRVVLKLPERFARPIKPLWDGRYLVAGYKSGEVLILDFNHVYIKRRTSERVLSLLIPQVPSAKNIIAE